MMLTYLAAINLSLSERSSLSLTIGSIFSSRDSATSIESLLSSSSTSHIAPDLPSSSRHENYAQPFQNTHSSAKHEYHAQHAQAIPNSSPANQTSSYSHFERSRY